MLRKWEHLRSFGERRDQDNKNNQTKLSLLRRVLCGVELLQTAVQDQLSMKQGHEMNPWPPNGYPPSRHLEAK